MKKINFETQLQQTIPPQEILGASQRVSGLPIKTGISRLLKASLILRGSIEEKYLFATRVAKRGVVAWPPPLTDTGFALSSWGCCLCRTHATLIVAPRS